MLDLSEEPLEENIATCVEYMERSTPARLAPSRRNARVCVLTAVTPPPFPTLPVTAILAPPRHCRPHLNL